MDPVSTQYDSDSSPAANPGTSDPALAELSQQWQSLADQVRHHREVYYYGNPEISDAEFDALLTRLQEFEDSHPEAVTGPSPTTEVARPLRSPARFATWTTRSRCSRSITSSTPSS